MTRNIREQPTLKFKFKYKIYIHPYIGKRQKSPILKAKVIFSLSNVSIHPNKLQIRNNTNNSDNKNKNKQNKPPKVYFNSEHQNEQNQVPSISSLFGRLFITFTNSVKISFPIVKKS